MPGNGECVVGAPWWPGCLAGAVAIAKVPELFDESDSQIILGNDVDNDNDANGDGDDGGDDEDDGRDMIRDNANGWSVTPAPHPLRLHQRPLEVGSKLPLPL